MMLIGDALRRSAGNYPDKPAVRDDYGKYFPVGTGYTYRELNETVNRLGNNLLALGLQKGDRVAVQTGTGLGPILSLLALAKVGMAIAPIDRTFMSEEIAYQVGDSGARAVYRRCGPLHKEDSAHSGSAHIRGLFHRIGDENPCEYSFMEMIAEGSTEEPQIVVAKDDMATLIYTSGTTGKPKGAPMTHGKWSFQRNRLGR